jgi:hypothetical protein
MIQPSPIPQNDRTANTIRKASFRKIQKNAQRELLL